MLPRYDESLIKFCQIDILNIFSMPSDKIDTVEQEDPTESETEFNKRYVALTHRLVHRRACIELNKRQADNSFGKTLLYKN